jgi:hypothetical protein
MKPNAKCGPVSGNNMDHFQVADLISTPIDVNIIAELYSHNKFSVVTSCVILFKHFSQ